MVSGYIDPEEKQAIADAFGWAQDHGFVKEHTSLEALLQTVERLAPDCDRNALRAYIDEMLVHDPAGHFVLALAPPAHPLTADTWRAGPIGTQPAGGRQGLAILIICEREYLMRLRGGAR